MSQVYLSKEDRVKGRGLDMRVVKSCILDSPCGLGLVERESLDTFLLPSIFETSDVRKRVDHVISRVFLCLFVHFKLSLASPMILLYSK